MTAASLMALTAREQHAFLPSKSQDHIAQAADSVRRLQRCEVVDPLCHFTGPFLKAVSERVQWFIRVVDPKGKVFIGIGALQYMLTDLEKRVAEDDSPITHLHVDHVGRYKHLLSAGECNLLGKLKGKVADRQARMSALPCQRRRRRRRRRRRSRMAARVLLPAQRRSLPSTCRECLINELGKS